MFEYSQLYLGFVQEQVAKHVGFMGNFQESSWPSRLHRRDTPHHLKNKRIHLVVDKEKVASIMAQVQNLLYLLENSMLLIYFNL